MSTRLRAGGAIYLEVKIKPGLWLSPARLLAAIENIGYVTRPADVRLTLTGTIVKQGDRLMLRLDAGGPQQTCFELLEANANRHDGKRQRSHLSILEGRIGKSIEVEGYWRDAQKGATMQTLRVTGQGE